MKIRSKKVLKMKKYRLCSAITFILLVLGVVSGCGYTTRSLLPASFKAIYVDGFKNLIKISAEQTNMRMYRGYRPGMEIEITKKVIDRFLFDGNLKVSQESGADLILKGELTDFRRDALRYGVNDDVEEYRITLVVNMELTEVKTGKTVWKENGFAGETTYRTGGALVKSESAAVTDAIQDLAIRIVDRTIEAW